MTSALAQPQDFFKRKLSIPSHPQRIISLSPATTEMLYAIHAEHVLVGVTNDCNFPLNAKNKTQTGRFGHIQLEKVLKLKPDLLLATVNMGPSLAPLKKLNIPILALHTPDVSHIIKNLTLLGRITGLPSIKVTTSMQERLTHFKRLRHEKVSPSAFYLLWDKPLITAGSTSFVGDVLKFAGVKNIVTESAKPFPHYSLEKLIKSNPDILIIPKTVSSRINLKKAPFNRLKSVKTNRVLIIDDDIISRPAPRVIQAIQKISNFF